MLKPEEAQDRADALISQAKKAGADAADAIYVCDASTQVQMRLGNLEDVERSEGEEIGLRGFVGKRSATASSSDMDPVILSALVGRAMDMAREAPEDQYAGLAPEELILKSQPDIMIDGDDGVDPNPEILREMALKAEDAARAVEGVTNSEGGGASAGRSIVALATSHGFSGAYSTSGYSCHASVIAGQGSAMERDYAYDSKRHFSDLEAAEEVGKEAGERRQSGEGQGARQERPPQYGDSQRDDDGVLPCLLIKRILVLVTELLPELAILEDGFVRRERPGVGEARFVLVELRGRDPEPVGSLSDKAMRPFHPFESSQQPSRFGIRIDALRAGVEEPGDEHALERRHVDLRLDRCFNRDLVERGATGQRQRHAEANDRGDGSGGHRFPGTDRSCCGCRCFPVRLRAPSRRPAAHRRIARAARSRCRGCRRTRGR